MTREEALQRISPHAYDQQTIAQDFEYAAIKFGLSVGELRDLMNGPNKSYRDYKSRQRMIDFGTQVLCILGLHQVIIR
jgi:hypothetical protein